MKNYLSLFLAWLAIALFGCVMLYSASFSFLVNANASPMSYVLQHLIIMIALTLLLIVPFSFKNVNYLKFFKNSSTVLIIAMIIILIGLFLLPGDIKVGGAKSTYIIGGQSFQPMEWFKIIILIYLSTKLSKPYHKSFGDLINIFLLPLFGSILILLQPDLGGFLVLGGVMLTMYILNGEQLKKLFYILGILGLVAVFFFTFILQPYQISRIKIWLNPFEYQETEGYQPIQGYIAIANGGIFGEGLLESSQKKGAVQEPFSDFIYAIILEELGLFGALLVTSLIFILVFFIVKTGIGSKNRTVMLYAFGLASLILIQSFINIGGVTGVIPLTGLTLPFISFGSNSFASLTIGVFLLIILDRQRTVRGY